MLQDSKTTMIVAASLHIRNRAETIRTLELPAADAPTPDIEIADAEWLLEVLSEHHDEVGPLKRPRGLLAQILRLTRQQDVEVLSHFLKVSDWI